MSWRSPALTKYEPGDRNFLRVLALPTNAYCNAGVAMADTAHDPESTRQDLRAHQQAFNGFSKLILFSILHVALVLACLALAFLGDTPLLALLIGLGGTFGLIVGFTFSK